MHILYIYICIIYIYAYIIYIHKVTVSYTPQMLLKVQLTARVRSGIHQKKPANYNLNILVKHIC